MKKFQSFHDHDCFKVYKLNRYIPYPPCCWPPCCGGPYWLDGDVAEKKKDYLWLLFFQIVFERPFFFFFFFKIFDHCCSSDYQSFSVVTQKSKTLTNRFFIVWKCKNSTCRNAIACGWWWESTRSTCRLTTGRSAERLLWCTVRLRWSTLSRTCLRWSSIRRRWPTTETALLWLTLLIEIAGWWWNIAWATLEIVTACKYNE